MGRLFFVTSIRLKIRVSYGNGTMFTKIIIRGRTQSHVHRHVHALKYIFVPIQIQKFMKHACMRTHNQHTHIHDISINLSYAGYGTSNSLTREDDRLNAVILSQHPDQQFCKIYGIDKLT
jgi:hypothetical protein